MGYDLRSNMTGTNLIGICMNIYYIIRWILIRYIIGILNIISGKVSPFYLLYKLPYTIYKACECDDYEFLFHPSPA